MPGVGTAFAMVFTWLAISLVLGGVAYRIISAAFEKELQPWEAVLLLAVDLLLLGVAVKLTGTAWLFLFLLLVGATLAVVEYLPVIFSQKHRRELWESDILRFQKGIDFDPKNVAAYSYLGDTYMKLGRFSEAVESYRKAVDLEPNSIEEKKKLEKALAEHVWSSTKEMLCPRCQLPRARGVNVCSGCGREFSFDETLSYNLRRTPQRQLLQLVLAGFAGIGIAVAMAMIGLPWLGWIIAFIVLAAAISVLMQLAKWK